MINMKEIFVKDPTRSLEEVQKVNDLERIEDDIEEFHETESAYNFLNETSKLISSSKHSNFIYLHATFGSGKTHLLKLLGLLVNRNEKFSHQKDKLIERFEGFQKVYSALKEEEVKFIPVFLNLLDRDVSQEPPLPLLIYIAIGKEIDSYEVEPLWLLEWGKRLDVEYGLWEELREYKYNGVKFKEVLDEKANLRSWLYQALPKWESAREVGFKSEEDVKRSIEKAEDIVKADNFSVQNLSVNIRQIAKKISKKEGKKIGFLFGLDEIALFIGDERKRFFELKKMINALREGSNPIIIGTGQWPLTYFQRNFFGETEEMKWCYKQLKLDSAETEVIVKNRWLQKKEEYKSKILKIVKDINKSELDTKGDINIENFSPIETYPFRQFDLWLLRDIIQGLLTSDFSSEHDHIQGRSLLVLVRSVFVNKNWAKGKVKDFVTWDVLFDVLAESTTYILTWIQDLVSRLEKTLANDVELISEVAKIIYLLNNSSKVLATSNNISILLRKNSDHDFDDLHEKVKKAIEKLNDLHYIHEEESKNENKIYKLLSQEEMSLADKIKTTSVSTSERRDRVLNWLKDNEFMFSANNKKEVEIKNEGKVPLKIRYSVFNEIHNPKIAYDAITTRIFITENFKERAVKEWQDMNSSLEYEDFLIVINLSAGLQEKIERSIARKKVLAKETKRYPELEIIKREEDRKLKEEIIDKLNEAVIYDSKGENRGSFGVDFEEVVKEEIGYKFPNRKRFKTSFQPIDDAEKIKNFFQNESLWPLSSDADMFGVDTMKNEIKGGWCTEFLDDFSDNIILSGEDILHEIEDREGRYLGTSQEAIQALLVILAVAKKISLKIDGKLLRDAKEIGRSLRTKEGLRKLTIKMEAPEDPQKQNKIKEMYELIIGTKSNTDDIKVLLEEISIEMKKKKTKIMELHKKTAYEFPENEGIKKLQEIFESAFSQDSFSVDILVNNKDEISQLIKRFKKAEMLFQTEKDKWLEFKKLKEKMSEIYPRETITEEFKQISNQYELPDIEEIDKMIEKSKDLRKDKLQNFYWLITGENIHEDKPNKIIKEIENYLYNNSSNLKEELNEIVKDLTFAVDFSQINDVMTKIQKQDFDLNEQILNNSKLKQDFYNLYRARTLKALQKDGQTLWDKFLNALEILKEKDKNTYISQWESKKNDKSIPRIEYFKNIIKESQIDEPDKSDEFEQFWQQMSCLSNGDIVLIDYKEE